MKQFQWDEYYEKFFDWAESARMKYASALTTFGCADEVYEVVLEISCDDEKCAAQLLDRALDAGVRFTPEQVVELAGTIDEQVVSKMAASSERPFDREQLEEIDGFLDDKTFKQISKRSGIDVYADDDPDIADWPEPQAKKPRFFATLLGIAVMDKALNGRSSGKHNGRCNGDCAHCPPHYGYRYGRWYYGHSHVHGCEFSGNKGDGSL